ncbi:MAG: type II toxin-antitoxin system prevent-host-death family antitoxin [Terracidiphilus sp.]|jgi:prevent-host-death family protein
MRTANIGTLKNQLSAYLKYVRNGEEVVVYDRNTPVARILPFTPPLPPQGDYAAEEAYLIATGQMKPPENPKPMDWDAFWALPRPTVSDEAVREAMEWAKGKGDY